MEQKRMEDVRKLLKKDAMKLTIDQLVKLITRGSLDDMTKDIYKVFLYCKILYAYPDEDENDPSTYYGRIMYDIVGDFTARQKDPRDLILYYLDQHQGAVQMANSLLKTCFKKKNYVNNWEEEPYEGYSRDYYMNPPDYTSNWNKG